MTWEERRDLLADLDETADPRGLCDELIGRLRVELDDLHPTPDPSLDAAVDAWIAQAETIAFDCPRDAERLATQLGDLEVLAAEVDAGVAADVGG